MSFRIFVACMFLCPLAGCTHFWQRHDDYEPGPAVVSDASGGDVVVGTESGGDQAYAAPAICGPACPAKPACPVKPPCPPQPKVIRIKIVPPKVEGEGKQNQGAPPPQPQPTAVNAPQEVMLVPRTVFVPFVAQTPTGPARILNLQGAVPLVAPTADQNLGAPPPAPEKKDEKKEGVPPPTPAPCKIEVTPSCPQPDLDAINKRLDRLDCLLQQLCEPSCPPPPLRRFCPK